MPRGGGAVTTRQQTNNTRRLSLLFFWTKIKSAKTQIICIKKGECSRNTSTSFALNKIRQLKGGALPGRFFRSPQTREASQKVANENFEFPPRNRGKPLTFFFWQDICRITDFLPQSDYHLGGHCLPGGSRLSVSPPANSASLGCHG